MTRSHAAATQADLDGRAIVHVSIGKIRETIVMNPGTLRHLIRARAVYNEHLALGKFILECIMVDFCVVSTDQQIMPGARKLESATRVTTVIRAGCDFFAAHVVRKLKPLND